ncbi:RDD family protein [Stenotrophomonas sp. 278]|uniref:RDD family protein n=1 Tax=Stenotrophomonas sp. 278 TaxID=2479851 RepID=UPI000F67FCB4|nr:RDD family protein [Stenotrophomonas sp. 278]RRU12331.1 RDD family protein [Stenotrophomonas sp. 278]
MATSPAAVAPKRPASLLLWRLLALLYDFFPALALWMLVGALFTAGYATGHATRENIAPFSALQWLLWACCWAVTGLYATLSWQRGGQTLGMRPWRLQVVGAEGRTPRRGQLWVRYAVGTLSVLLGGLGLWWALVDRQRLSWHDRASGTRILRLPKRPNR